MRPKTLIKAAIRIVRKYALPADLRKKSVARALDRLAAEEPSSLHEEAEAVNKMLKVVNRHSFLIWPKNLNGTSIMRTGPEPAVGIRASNGALRLTIPTGMGLLDVEKIRDALRRHSGKIVIDLSSNEGGDMRPLFLALTPLLPAGTPLVDFVREGAKPLHVVQGEAALVFTRRRVLLAPLQLKNVFVVVGRRTASSAEIVALALKGHGAILLGEPTAGFLSNNVMFKAPGGFVVNLTYSRISLPGRAATRQRLVPNR